MTVTMYRANGIGLAAPQVAHFIRAFVIDTAAEGGTGGLQEFINPVIRSGQGSISYEEGCLSVPGISETVKRKDTVVVEYKDRFGKPQTITAHDLLAVAIQHENDHLDGVLFLDRLSPLKRRMARKKAEKMVTL